MKERKFVLGALIACLVLAAATLAGLAAAKPGKKAAEPFKVAWIYPGPYNDGGWSSAHDAGRLYAQKMLGGKIKTTYKDKAFSNAQVPQIVAGLVRDGYQMIFATSFGSSSSASTASSTRSTRRSSSSRRRARRSSRTSRSTSARPRTRSTSRAWPRARPRRRA